jgi:hypothetical protein
MECTWEESIHRQRAHGQNGRGATLAARIVGRAACAVLLCLAVAGCQDSKRVAELIEAIDAGREAIAKENAAISALRAEAAQIEGQMSKIAAERAPLAAAWARERSDSPNLSACAIEDLGMKGLDASITGSTEDARTLGMLAAVFCGVASFGRDYQSVKQRFDALRADMAAIDQRLGVLEGERLQAVARLDRLQANRQAPALERDLALQVQALACERDFVCRAKAWLGQW